MKAIRLLKRWEIWGSWEKATFKGKRNTEQDTFFFLVRALPSSSQLTWLDYTQPTQSAHHIGMVMYTYFLSLGQEQSTTAGKVSDSLLPGRIEQKFFFSSSSLTALQPSCAPSPRNMIIFLKWHSRFRSFSVVSIFQHPSLGDGSGFLTLCST